MAFSRRMRANLQFLLFCGILLFVNVLANSFHTYFDLTEEKRYTLTKPTTRLLKNLDDRIYVQVLLDGDFPAGFKRLQTSTRELLDDFRGVSGFIDYKFSDPNVGTVEEINERRKALSEEGIVPINLRVRESGESSQKIIYPVAIFHFGNRRIPVKLLENNSPSLSPDEVINNSVSLLEYKFANAIKKLRSPFKPIILFTRGHGELDELQTKDLEKGLLQFYETDRITLDSVVTLEPEKCALLVVAKPRFEFSEQEKFKVDQYIMSGGKVLWMIDRLNADIDSMRSVPRFVPSDYPINLEDMLFKYGVRIQPDLIVDLECTKIPLSVGQVGNAPQLELFDWYYHPAVRPQGKHPVVKNLDRVELKFCSSMDTIRTKTKVVKTPILTSSKYSRLQFSPIELNFEVVRWDPDPAKFNKGEQTVGVLLEGVFASNYENRVSQGMLEGLKQLGVEYKAQSVENRMIVISDGDVAANVVRDRAAESWYPLGYNRFENNTYANKELLMNAIEYLIEADGVIEARTKEVKLRLLDNVKAKEERTKWQLINIIVPLAFLGIFALLFLRLRKRKYTKKQKSE